MKRSLLFCFLAALLFFACRKDDNPKIPELTRVPTPTVAIDAASDKVISPVNPTAFKGKVNVDLLFPGDIKPQKLDLVIIKNGNKANVKTLRADITTFPTTVDITGQQLVTLFGGNIEPGDNFDIGADITMQNGQKFQAFPVVGDAYGSNVGNQPGASLTVQFLRPCPFVASAYAGTFEVLQDEWQDYSVGNDVQVSVVSPTQISFQYKVDAGTAKPIILTIDPATNAISVAKQVYGSYGTDVFSAESVAGPASQVNPCDLSLSVRLRHTTTGFSGSYTIRLKKK
ncbi:hypothetical protein V9K67_20535 [Paraflavisolibacter sp. H34]|uniref:hypothetical protein n=1 Tax=Huijunlia imazamoxiresistens TaxID=3127457 RepID=UPI003015A41B